MTTSRIAAIQRRAESAIERAADNEAVVKALRDAYTIELGEAQMDEQRQGLVIRDLQASAMLWQAEVKHLTAEVERLQVKVAEIAEFKPFADAGIKFIPDTDAKLVREHIFGIKPDEEQPR